MTVQFDLASVFVNLLHILGEERLLYVLVQKGWDKDEDQISSLLIIPYDLHHLDLLLDQTQLDDVIYIINCDAKEKVHDYDRDDADEHYKNSLAGVREDVGNGHSFKHSLLFHICCSGFSDIILDSILG